MPRVGEADQRLASRHFGDVILEKASLWGSRPLVKGRCHFLQNLLTRHSFFAKGGTAD